MSKFKSGFITIIGKPNVGKSTLLNQIIGQNISITANKPQTTRNQIRGIVTEKNYQAIFIDTPGIHEPSTELHKRIVNYAIHSLVNTDIILYITEPLKNQKLSSDDQNIIEKLSFSKDKVILLLNKIDAYAEKMIFDSIQFFSEHGFKDIVPISALKKKNLGKFLKMIPERLPEGIMYYPEEQFTDATERSIVGELVREQVFRRLKQEIPYGVAVSIDSMKELNNKTNIHATIYVLRSSHKKILIGTGGEMIKEIGTVARKKIEFLLGIPVFLGLHVKIMKNWTNDDRKLTELGYQALIT